MSKAVESAAKPLPQTVNTEDAQSPFDADDLVKISRLFPLKHHCVPPLWKKVGMRVWHTRCGRA
jgi:hypothetical protein